jgi:MFS family permease
MALQMTSFVMILPLFARRLADFGAGVEALGLSALAYNLAATVAAPLMGSLADRVGKRTIVLGSLAAYALAFMGFLLVRSPTPFILLRGLAGGLTAGLIPAVMGIVGDIAPEDRRAQHVGIVNGGASMGWIAGPVFGGLLFDRWGYVVPFAASVVIALLTLALAYDVVPGSRPVDKPAPRPKPRLARPSLRSFAAPWSAHWPSFAALLTIALGVMFAWAFIEPPLMFYAYDDLSWTSSQLGLVMSVFGLATAVGEFALGRLSDRWGRRPILALGLLLFSAQFAGLAWSSSAVWIVVSFLLAGMGNALFDPALNAAFLELAPPEHRSGVMGMKSTAGSLGSLLGPGLVVLLTPQLAPRQVFLAALLLSLALVALAGLCVRARSEQLSKV